MNGISAHIIRMSESQLALYLTCDDTRSQLSATQKWVLTRTWPGQHLDLKVSFPITVRNTFLSFSSHPVYSILLEKLEIK